MPTHSEFIPFHKPAIGEDEIESVVETLKSGWLTTGPKVKRFEEDFARYVGLQPLRWRSIPEPRRFTWLWMPSESEKATRSSFPP